MNKWYNIYYYCSFNLITPCLYTNSLTTFAYILQAWVLNFNIYLQKTKRWKKKGSNTADKYALGNCYNFSYTLYPRGTFYFVKYASKLWSLCACGILVEISFAYSLVESFTICVWFQFKTHRSKNFWCSSPLSKSL